MKVVFLVLFTSCTATAAFGQAPKQAQNQPSGAPSAACQEFLEYTFEDGVTTANKQLDHLDVTDNLANEEQSKADQIAAERAKGLSNDAALANAESAARTGEKMFHILYCGHCKQIPKDIEKLDSQLRASCSATEVSKYEEFLEKLRDKQDAKCVKKKPYDQLCSGTS
jgi:hypothetical protein